MTGERIGMLLAELGGDVGGIINFSA